ncbi:MAG TPA: hypothetical protein VHU61_06385 [Solirubrobacteraceae bacterium]|nr:hypothetical protein [Solirubrobacteraceae bacterium]
MKRLAVITAILASVALIAVPTAFADGDPASDVLVESSLFNPIGSGVSLSTQTRLEAVLDASERAGFPIRVALIAAASDLGTATAFWRQPGNYVGYLGYELSGIYRGQVLVVMPNGFGLYGPRSGPYTVSAAEHAVKAAAPGAGEQLATAALSAIPLLARADRHPLPASALTAAERTAVPNTSGASGSLGLSAVIALLIGVLLVAVAWTLSLRARPLRQRRRPAA